MEPWGKALLGAVGKQGSRSGGVLTNTIGGSLSSILGACGVSGSAPFDAVTHADALA